MIPALRRPREDPCPALPLGATVTRALRYLSVCSGIEAATVAWHPLGWRPVAFSEIDPFPSAVLAHHYPSVPNWGDMTRFEEWPDADVDVLVGGTPCQDYSVAGQRLGMAGSRSQLTLTYVEIAARYRPRWILWESVPGVFSSNGGRDFARLLGELSGQIIPVPDEGWKNSGIVSGIGDAYGLAWCVRDAQYVRTLRFSGAVPQRRRRVFLVGYLGDWRPAAAVLLVASSMRGDPPPRREPGQGAAPTLAARTRGGGGLGTDFDLDGGLIPDVANPLTARMHKGVNTTMDEGQTMVAQPIAFDCKSSEAKVDETGVTPTLRAMGHSGSHANAGGQLAVAAPLMAGMSKSSARMPQEQGALVPVAFQDRFRGDDGRGYDRPPPVSEGVCGTLETVKPWQVAVAFDAQAGGSTGGFIGEPSERFSSILEERHADAYEADASSVLSTLRDAVGAKAYEEWGLRILAAFQSPEVLRNWMLGASCRVATEEARPQLDDGALPRAKDSPSNRVLRTVWEEGPDGRSSQGRGLAKQLAGEPGAALSVLPYQGASSEGEVQLVRQAREGARLLREALSAVQEVGRPAGGKGEPAQPSWMVRRLTPLEAERLQGFPDGYTDVPYRRRNFTPDGPRYKALGNSMAVNAMEWLGERIALVDDLIGGS